MTEQEPTTAQTPPAEPAVPAATAPVELPKPEKQEPDWRAAYVGLQTNLNKSHARQEDLLRQNAALADSLVAIKKSQDALALQQIPDEESKKAYLERQAVEAERAAAKRAAESASQFIEVQTTLLLETLETAGVPRAEFPELFKVGATAANPSEWAEAVRPAVIARIQKQKAAYDKAVQEAEAKGAAKTQAQIKVEAEELARRSLKEAGVDKIDTAKGSGSSNFLERVAALKPGTPEFEDFKRRALQGTLNIK